MIIWRGWGILVAFFLAAALIGSEYLCRTYLAPDYTKTHHWPMAAALAAAGLASWVIGGIVNRDDQGYGNIHHLYFIPMQWWGGLLLLVAGVIFLVGVANPPQAEAAKPPPQGQVTIIKRR